TMIVACSNTPGAAPALNAPAGRTGLDLVRPAVGDIAFDWVTGGAEPAHLEGGGGYPNAGCSDSPWVQGFAPTREHLHSPVLNRLTSRTISFTRSRHGTNSR